MHRNVTTLNRCCWAAFFALVVASYYYDISWMWAWIPLGAMLVLQFAAGRAPTADQTRPVEVRPPVTGRWSALNSPADKAPSHGTHAYGQTYAIDVVAEPAGGTRPRFGWWPIMRRNRDFPAFGAPLHAVADATVVRATDRQRDHLSRNSYPALLYLVVEGAVRELLGAHRVIGNHLVLDLGDGTFALYAHLRRGSLKVRAGDRVTAGQVLAECGDSGNSSEPHVHFQLMDRPDPAGATGVPFTWFEVGVPANGETFSVAGPAPR
ncbi:peptidase [Sphaerisporangium rufum]|uniref:Peptidase n=1 Tax=Sphaerisporangium rufum TaxID=1381558 RepID=A0A919QX65_9ACTN|nr:M23 family metallopeptidase [Sphaerisporangium rufum]GII75774.1 peptidase [Sphaerisporangium rufum]